MNRTVVKGHATHITDSSLSIYVMNDSGEIIYTNINVTEIRKIKIKKNAFLKGLIIGAGIGGITGYEIGEVTYSDDNYMEDENAKEARAIAGAVIIGIPCAVIGGIVGSVVIKKTFIINGSKENYIKMFEELWKFK